MISGRTRIVALIGDPVEASLSPQMQNAAFSARALDWAYVALRVPSDRLPEALRGVAALGFAGANVTTPHKTRAAELCDELDAEAVRAAAVNTLSVVDGRVLGSTTDGAVVADMHAGRAAVVGAGGAARSIVSALETAGTDVRVFSRRGKWPPDVTHADLVVNATPVRDETLFEPLRGQTVIDLPYRADGRPTATVSAARAAGCAVVDGLEALVRQGAASFERWTGMPAPVDVMRAAVRP